MRRAIIFILIVAAIGAGYYYRADLSAWLKGAQTKITQEIGQLQKIQKQVFAPTPLRGPTADIQSSLTASGVITETNRQRAINGGLPALTFNAQLTAAAQTKANDLFAKQYFEHVSPTGVGPGDLATAAGYAYLVEGENLAMGNFENDAALVKAWMNSPGHRANILNTKYAEIGVAVQRGTYEGHRVWMAVQEFGRPLSDCPEPSASLEAQIKTNNNQLDALQVEISTKKQEIDAMSPKRGAEYNQKVDEYNALVAQFNELVTETKQLIAQYNIQVNAFNACIQ